MPGWDWSLYRGDVKWLPERTIYLTRHGSLAYRTNLPTSDLDVRGLCVVPREYAFGFLHRFEQAEQREPVDLVVFDVRKFFALAAEGNPNVIEILFTDAADHLFVHPVMERVLAARRQFLSRKLQHTFAGYARSQLGRIQRHYRWLKNPPSHAPTRAAFGLPERPTLPHDQRQAAESLVRKRVDALMNPIDWQAFDEGARLDLRRRFTEALLEAALAKDEEALWRTAATTLGFSTNFLETVEAERRYQSAVAEWTAYRTWLAERNEARAALERQHGYDTKHAMHLVRLMRMAQEILETGEVRVARPDAAELLAIRHGAWTYEDLLAWADAQEARVRAAAEKSALPHAPDRKALDRLCVEVTEGLGGDPS